MKKILSFLLFACFTVTLFSQTIVSTTPSNRNGILEEFTGKTCQFCPDGHKRAQQLMNQYPDRFFAINVHQGGYASGTPNYTTPYGNSLASQAGMGQSNTGYPAGTVNRQAFTGVPLMGSSYFLYDRGRWASCVNMALNEPSCLNVAATGTLDALTRHLTLLVEVYYTGNAEQSTNKLTVAMLQSEILGPQTGGAQYYPEMMVGNLYRHMHMLRDYVTGTQWGMDVTPTTTGSFWSHTFEYDVPEQFNNIEVVLKNLAFIVFVSENEKKIITGSQASIKLGPTYTITASAGENGTISLDGETEFLAGESAVYTFTPDSGYKVDEVLVNGESVEFANNSYTFPAVDKDYEIHVTFKLIPEYTITATAGENGAISPAGAKEYVEGTSAVYTFTPNLGYVVDEVLVDGAPVSFANNKYTFTSVNKDYTIHVTFKSAPKYIITATAGENGAISPDGETEYFEGASPEYTFTPNNGFKVDEVLVDGEPVEFDNNTYTFPAVNKDYTIHVTFKLIESIKDINGIAISVAPNPMNDKLYITGMYDKLEIVSISGQVISTAYNQPSVDVTHLSQGIYFVKIQSNGQISTFKVVK